MEDKLFGKNHHLDIQEKNNKTFYLPMGKAFLKKIDYKYKRIILDLEIDFIEN